MPRRPESSRGQARVGESGSDPATVAGLIVDESVLLVVLRTQAQLYERGGEGGSGGRSTSEVSPCRLLLIHTLQLIRDERPV